ncbi:MAG: hypothetical protein ACYSW8_28435, partial [Planctomycetota bacterium]
ATLHSLSNEDPRFRRVADRYWNARGGSHTDGGAFSFTIDNASSDNARLSCADKFGAAVTCLPGNWAVDLRSDPKPDVMPEGLRATAEASAADDNAQALYAAVAARMADWDFDAVRWLVAEIEKLANASASNFHWALEVLSLLNNRRYNCGKKKRSVVLQIIRQAVDSILDATPAISDNGPACARRVDWQTRDNIRAPK